MDREEAFEFLDRTARGIAEMFGSTCETLDVYKRQGTYGTHHGSQFGQRTPGIL